MVRGVKVWTWLSYLMIALDETHGHVARQVAAFSSIMDKDLADRRRTAEVDIQPLLGDSYASRIQAELKKRLKAAPTAFYAEPPQALFTANVAAAAFPGWAFS